MDLKTRAETENGCQPFRWASNIAPSTPEIVDRRLPYNEGGTARSGALALSRGYVNYARVGTHSDSPSRNACR